MIWHKGDLWMYERWEAPTPNNPHGWVHLRNFLSDEVHLFYADAVML